MRDKRKITKLLLKEGSRLLIVLPFVAITLLLPTVWAEEEAESKYPPSILFYKSESDENLQTTLKTLRTLSVNQLLPAQVSIFYPTKGQSQYGRCWQGLMIDSNENVYPVASGMINKILPDGTLVNGVDDQNFFATGSWRMMLPVLDEDSGKIFASAGNYVGYAPFLEGSTFSVLISGLNYSEAITMGQGPLGGSLFATERMANQVSRITLFPLGLSMFSSGISFFTFPNAIASAPDGTMYVVNFLPTRLTKITPDGIPSTFATGTSAQHNRAIIVDDAGNVYWSHANGINKYDPDGNFLGMLPGPPDKFAFGGPMGAAFDNSGNLYIVDNGDCKKIYKYTFEITVVIDIKPGSLPNSINPHSRGRIPLAIISTSTLEGEPLDFDASTVDETTVLFGPTGTEAATVYSALEDVDGDGDNDMVLHFKTQDSGILCGDTSASITGETFSGQPIEGSDSINTVDCE